MVHLTFDCVFGKGAYLQVLTPVEPLCQKMIHHVYFQKYVPRIIPKFFLLAEALMVRMLMMHVCTSSVLLLFVPFKN